MHRYYFHVGPTLVEHFAADLSRSGFKNVLAGTEKVWFDSHLTEAELEWLVPVWARLVRVW